MHARKPHILDEIVAAHRRVAVADSRDPEAVLAKALESRKPIDVAKRLRTTPGVAIIAEIKRKSPSQGTFVNEVDVVGRAKQYAAGGATCLSILTDEEYFGGSVEDVRAVRAALPDVAILRKDFTVDVRDIYDARVMGADMVLLIVAALSDDELRTFLQAAQTCGLTALFEAHNEDEIHRAVQCGATVVGVNQRDLQSFAIEGDRACDLFSAIPAGVCSVAESGVRSSDDVAAFAAVGFDAALVGTAFMQSDDPRLLVHAMVRAGNGVR